nr:MAG TPA: hypothetical protein [Caudoviricetes sp.]
MLSLGLCCARRDSLSGSSTCWTRKSKLFQKYITCLRIINTLILNL